MTKQIVSIIIERVEGPCDLCVTHVFTNLIKASEFIDSQNHTYALVGYDKHDVEVMFSDNSRIEFLMCLMSRKNDSFLSFYNDLCSSIDEALK